MKVKKDYSLTKANTWMIGGSAAQCLIPESVDDLRAWIKSHPHDTLLWLGLGSNVLLADGHLPFNVIQTRSFLNQMTRINAQWIIDAGVNCARIARECSRAGYRDAVFFCGIPGTLGGAVRMNAGAFGGETWQHVDWVDIMTRDGGIERFEKSAFKTSYRQVEMPVDGWIIRAGLTFHDYYPLSQVQLIAELLKKRMLTQPIGVFSCGSVFKNPQGDYAARLIESAGLKGHRIGYAEVSEKHANFMINIDGRSSAQDMYDLMYLAKEEVFKLSGIQLDLEVHCFGFE